MAAEEVLKLFDSYWFKSLSFSKKPFPLPHAAATTTTKKNPTHQIQEPNFPQLPTLHVRSLSDQFLSTSKTSSFSSDSPSPNSVTTTPKLQTIFSGKEILEFSKDEYVEQEEQEAVMPIENIEKKVSESKRKRNLGSAKSLSDLEFEELKGFMDLGFMFSEEDKDSRLVSIIPGLQRLGRKGSEDGEEEERKNDETVVSRPYLSEAWDFLDQRKIEYTLMNLKVPTLGNEMDMKDQLKFWAHTVASTVK